MNIVDWAQVITAVSTAIAAIAALITTIQNKRSNDAMNTERHLLVKPYYKVKSTFEDRIKKIIELSVINLGFDKYLRLMVEWVGTPGVEVKVIEALEKNKNEIEYDLKIAINYSKCPEKEDIHGSLILVYSDVLNKIYRECIPIEVKYIYYPAVEEYNPELQNKLIGMAFENVD